MTTPAAIDGAGAKGTLATEYPDAVSALQQQVETLQRLAASRLAKCKELLAALKVAKESIEGIRDQKGQKIGDYWSHETAVPIEDLRDQCERTLNAIEEQLKKANI